MDASPSSSSGARSKRKQMRSCDDCYRRKVRCDSVNQEICGACRRSQVECRFTRHGGKPSGLRQRRPQKHGAHKENRERAPRLRMTEASSNASPSDELSGGLGSSTADTQQEVVGNDIIISQDLVRSGLSQFLSVGVAPSSSWEVFDEYERVRIAYVGTDASNLTHLIHLGNSTAATGLHHPYPHIKPPLAWKPEVHTNDPLRSASLIQDICSFPARDVRDDLVDSFFAHVHPFFPIVDEYQFRSQYNNPDNPPPLILLQSILLVGAHTSHHHKVARARSTVKAVLFRRAKALFDMRHENDRLNLIQAAILFTWYIENADTVSSNSWYWLGIACRIAFGIGMHRDLSKYSVGRFPAQDRRVYRRVWWCLFQLEITSALEHGRPSMIRIEDSDQPLMEVDDLRDANGLINQNINYGYCCRKVELCYIALEVSRLSSPGIIHQPSTPAAQSVNSRLILWARSKVSNNEYETLNLDIFYQMIVIHWHRTTVNTNLVGEEQSVEICKGASKSIIADFESLSSQNLLFRSHFAESFSLTAAAIQTHREIQDAIERRQPLQAMNALGDLERVLRIAKSLSEYWPNAEAVFKLFKGLLDNFKDSPVFDGGFSNSDQSFDENTLRGIDWHQILAYQPSEQPFNEGWLNDLPDVGGLG